MSALLSVIIPCWNAEDFVAQAVESALAQRGGGIEVIAVDDGSTDGTPEVLDRFGDEICVLRQSNQGRSVARNRGLGKASGEFVAFLDADDWWAPEFAARMIGALERTGAGIAYCGWQNVGLTGERAKPFIPPDYEGSGKIPLLLENARWPIHAAIVRRRLAVEVGGFARDLSYSEDFLFWLEVAVRATLIRVPRVLAYYRHHRDGHLALHRADRALSHLCAQQRFLSRHPQMRRKLGRGEVRARVYGELRRRAFTAYWRRELHDARLMFRQLMAAGYGSPRDWLYMLPSLLPESLHKAVLGVKGKGSKLE